MKNQSQFYRNTPIPHRAKNGDPMTYYIVDEDGNHTSVTRKICLAHHEGGSDGQLSQRWFVDEESGMVVRLPRTAKGDDLARENMRSVWREAKRQERWAGRIVAPTVDEDGNEIPVEPADTSEDADIIGFLEEKALLDTLDAALATLAREDLDLIKDIFWHGKTERQIASDLGLSQKTVNKRKRKLLGKIAENDDLKSFFE